MKGLRTILLFVIALAVYACNPSATSPKPTEIFENGEGEQEGGFRKYYEDSRRAALGESWESITNANFLQAEQARMYPKEDAFAGGVLEGNWYERGSSTVSGSIIATYFYPSTEDVYAVTSSGTLIKGGLTGGAWSILNDFANFNSEILAVVPISGGKRIITAKSDHKVYYSDDEGTTWTQAAGSIANAYSWGAGGKKLIVLSNGILYYLQHVWLSAPDTWGSGYKLHRSADNGATWTTTRTFNTRDENRVTMWSPLGSDELYVLDNGATVYTLSGTASTLTTLSTNTNLTTGAKYSFTGYKNGGNLTLYTLVNSSTIYKSTDNGATWSNISTISPTAWGVGMLANPWVADAIYYGAVDFYKSTAATPLFSTQNGWGAYYGNNDLLHADMVSIRPYEKTDGTKFILIGNHGGIHYYPAPFTTTTNLTKTNITSAEYYDVVTVAGSTIFAGAQDQGNQRFSGAAGTSILTASQLISGDYVRLNTSVNGTKYWQEYPFTSSSCTFHYYNSPLTQTGTTAQTSIYGSPNSTAQQWVTPTCNWAIPSENSILVGGGTANSSGSSGSHVIKMTYNGSSIVKSEYPFDFNAAGSGYITALDHSPADVNYMYVGLNNGKFYYSHDAGTTWTQTAGFTGATSGFNYGSFIHASRLNKNMAFYCGSGGKVYKTTNGGTSFTNMSTGLPNSFVNELVLNTAETLLFAATDAGPYVCVLSTGQWYSMAGTTAPVKSFTAVEYIAADNIVRFATFGRGVWDFQITSQPLPVTLADFKGQVDKDQSVRLTWTTQTEQNVSHFDIERSLDGQNFRAVTSVSSKSKGGNSNTRVDYTTRDLFPPTGLVYYRLKTHDLDGKTTNSKVISLQISGGTDVKQWAITPSVVAPNTPLSIFMPEVTGSVQLSLYDVSGRLIRQMPVTHGQQIDLNGTMPTGVLIYRLDSKTRSETGKVLVL